MLYIRIQCKEISKIGNKWIPAIYITPAPKSILMPRPMMTGNRDAHDYLRKRYYQLHQPHGVTQIPYSKSQARAIAFAEFLAKKRAMQQQRR